MSNEYEDLLAEVEGLRNQVRNLASRARVGNPVYGGPINADVTQSAKTSGPFLWIVDSTHSLEVVVPIQSYVHRVLDAKLRVTLRPVRVGSAVGGAPNITTTSDSAAASSATTTDDNAQASSASTSADSSPASSVTTTDDNAASSSSSTSGNNAASSSSSTSDVETAASVAVATSIHVHQWAGFIGGHADNPITAEYSSWDPAGTGNWGRFVFYLSAGNLGFTALPSTTAGAATVSVAPTGHQHGIVHTHSHDHSMTHTHNHHHDITHTHTHGHGMTHTHNHHHSLPHTHNHNHTLDHTHTTTVGSSLIEGGLPTGVRLYLDTGAGYTELTSALGGPWSVDFEVSLVNYFNDTLQPRQPKIGNHKLLLTSASIGTLEVNLDWYQMLKPVTSA